MPPIKPDEVARKRAEAIPEKVLDAFNALIVENWNGHFSTFRMNSAAARVADAMGCTTAHVYEKKWLDVEEVFEGAGWKVEFDKPAYNEMYPATFTFRKG